MAGFALPLLPMMGACAAAAAGALLLLGWPWRKPHPLRLAVGWVLGIGAAYYVGVWLLDLWPDPPPWDDQQRFLIILLPAALAVELVATLSGGRWWLAWPLRLAIAAGAARLLLHHTVYLEDLEETGSPRWTPAQIRLTLAVLAALVLALWAGLAGLNWVAPGRSVLVSLALTCGGAAAVISHSRYASAGLLALPLAAGLLGAAAGSLVLRALPGTVHALGVGVVGLFGLLVMGRYIAELTTTHALMLLGAPLLGWLPELPYVRRLPPWVRGVLRVVLTAVPVAIAVVQAAHPVAEDAPSTPTGDEPTREDYENFKP
jgi:hypothetical protein